MSFWGFREYVPVAQRRANALKEVAKLRKQGRAVSPVVIEDRKIAKSFWGKAWCDNLQRYSDHANRLPRGRTYVNNGSVIDLQIARGKVEALVSGTESYKVRIDIAVAAPARWKAICADCAGSIASIVELLQGKLAQHVMARVCREADGLFPELKEVEMSCSCPDWAGMCKHVAATLYGVGARLDHDPDMLFTLRGVDRRELVSAGADLSITQAAVASARLLVDDDVAALFGLEFEAPTAQQAAARSKKASSLGNGAVGRAGKAKFVPAMPPATSVCCKETGAESKAPAPSGRAETTGQAVLANNRAAAPLSKRERSASPKAACLISEGGAPKSATARSPGSGRHHDKPSHSTNGDGHVNPDQAQKSWPAPIQSAKPSAKPKATKRPTKGRARAAKWIGAKGRKSARK